MHVCMYVCMYVCLYASRYVCMLTPRQYPLSLQPAYLVRHVQRERRRIVGSLLVLASIHSLDEESVTCEEKQVIKQMRPYSYSKVPCAPKSGQPARKIPENRDQGSGSTALSKTESMPCSLAYRLRISVKVIWRS